MLPTQNPDSAPLPSPTPSDTPIAQAPPTVATAASHVLSEAPEKPKSSGDLFVSFAVLALQGFGGVIAIAQREIVERRRWMTREQFVEEWAVAQILPGPNVVNLGIMIGHEHFGFRGAVAAVAGLLLLPMVLVLFLAILYAHYASTPIAAGALRGMGAVAAGLIGATGLKLSTGLKQSPLGLPVCLILGAASFAVIAIFHQPLYYVLLVGGGIAWALAYRKIAK